MKKEHKQTWWDKEIKSQFNEFKSWVGPSSSPSKVWSRKYIKDNDYTSIVDIGCGNATEYFAYEKENPKVMYTGVDSSQFLYNKNKENNVPMILADADKTGLKDNSTEVAYSRHVLEHQASYEPILTEMIRISSKLAMHIFFIPPREKEIINYNESNNLYHNTFSRSEIEEFLTNHDKVDKWDWVPILSTTEEVLVINLK